MLLDNVYYGASKLNQQEHQNQHRESGSRNAKYGVQWGQKINNRMGECLNRVELRPQH